MMTPFLRLSLPRLDRRALGRGLVAGTAWGLLLASGLTAIEAARCGVICLDAAAFTALLSIAIGVLTIGPLAAFSRADRLRSAGNMNSARPFFGSRSS